MQTQFIAHERILRLPEVKKITGLSTSTLYLWMDQDKFPKSVNLGNRSVGWLESDVSGWLQARINLAKMHSDAKQSTPIDLSIPGE